MAELGIPQSVRVAIQSRLRVLPGSTQEVLRLAAVLGREFSFDTLAAATAAAAPDTAGAGAANRQEMLLDALERAEQAQLIEAVSEGEGGTFAFAHGLIPATLVDGLRVMQRRQLHRQAAAAIESRHPDDWETLAHHYSQAGQAEQAVVYLLKAGDRARSLYASQEAAGYYQQALVYLREQGDREGEARTLMKLGLVYTAAFQPDRAREAYDEAFRLWAPLRESREPEAAQAPAAVLRLAEMEPPTLDPGMMGDDTSAFIGAQLFEGLTRVDPEYNVLPAAASHWEILDNGQRYLFRLRPGLHWSDGLPLSAADFEYAWKRSLAMASQSPVAHLLYVVENARALGEGLIDDAGQVGVAALDRQTLEVRLEGPTAYLPHLLAHAVAYPLPRRIVEGPRQPWTDAENLVSNGPYQLAEWRRGDKLVLARNPFYPGQFPGNVDCVECRLFADFGSVLPAYEAGELDAISMINADQGTIARARTAYGSELAFMPQPSIFFLVFRTDQAPFDDVRVRQAFVHAVDRPALAREVWQGQYSPATGGFVPPGMAGHSAGIGLPYDPERAALLLADAGYPDGRGFPEVTWLCSGGSFDNPVIPFLRRAWQRTLGLDLEARSLDWAEFWGELMERRDRDPPHLSSWGWLADYPDPDSLLRVVFHSTEGVHPGHWHHARFDALVEKAGRIAEQPRRMELYREADRILVAEEAAVMPLGYVRGRILVKPWVTVPRVPPVMMRLKDVRVQRPDE
jgi:oligopeptide transport system substrate-binding protein